MKPAMRLLSILYIHVYVCLARTHDDRVSSTIFSHYRIILRSADKMTLAASTFRYDAPPFVYDAFKAMNTQLDGYLVERVMEAERKGHPTEADITFWRTWCSRFLQCDRFTARRAQWLTGVVAELTQHALSRRTVVQLRILGDDEESVGEEVDTLMNAAGVPTSPASPARLGAETGPEEDVTPGVTRPSTSHSETGSTAGSTSKRGTRGKGKPATKKKPVEREFPEDEEGEEEEEEEAQEAAGSVAASGRPKRPRGEEDDGAAGEGGEAAGPQPSKKKKPANAHRRAESTPDKTDIAKATVAPSDTWKAIEQGYRQAMAENRKQLKDVQKEGGTKALEELESADESMGRQLEAPSKGQLTTTETNALKAMLKFFCRDVLGDAGTARMQFAVERARTVMDDADETTSGSASLALVPAGEDMAPIFAKCASAYRRSRLAQGDEAAANRMQHQRAAEFYRAWEALCEETKDIKGPAAQKVLKYSHDRGRVLRQGVGIKTLQWDWLAEREYSQDQLDGKDKREAACRALRDDMSAGQRLDRCEAKFGPGIYAFMPQGAGRTCVYPWVLTSRVIVLIEGSRLRGWATETFNTFLDQFDERLPWIRPACDSVQHRIDNPYGHVALPYADGDSTHMPAETRIYEIITSNVRLRIEAASHGGETEEDLDG